VQTGRAPQTAKPDEAGFDPGRLAEAIGFAASRGRFSVQVFRNNCLVARGPNDEQSGKVPWNVWSVTKSVTSLVAGAAYDEGKLDLKAPIGKYFPPGFGDPAHRAITVENLLQEASGLQKAVLTEGITALLPLDPNVAAQAAGLPLDDEPGSKFGYSQRNVDLLAYVVERAVGEPMRSYAQRKIFAPLGIASSDYHWGADRSGNTYGYAHLLIPPNDLSKLGVLLTNNGRWGGKTVISQRYLTLARTPSPGNHCYGYLFWLAGRGCGDGLAALPAGSYAMSGLGMQNVFVVPSLGIAVMWTGLFGNVAGPVSDTDELATTFFRTFLGSVRSQRVPVPPPYVAKGGRFDVNAAINPDMVFALFGMGPSAFPGCTVFACLQTPLAPPGSHYPPGCNLLVCLGSDPRTPGIH
jgi:CubicO group peptidase (beta-lactamase class C family)